MSLVRQLVIGTVLLVLATFILVRSASSQTASQSLGTLLVIVLLAAALVATLGTLLASRIAALTAAVRGLSVGSTPRLPRVGIPEIDQLGDALRQMHDQVSSQVESLQGEQRDSTTIIDAMIEGVIAADPRGRITLANPAARRMLGYTESADLPMLPTLFRSKSARAAIAEVLGGAVVRDRELEMDDAVLLLNARPHEDRGVVLVLHDLTEVRRLELVRRDFIANASHELKTPLTSIAGYAETLASDSDMDEAIRQGFIKTIFENSRRMQHLVDDLLDLSRIESGRWSPNMATVDLGRIANETWQTLTRKAAVNKVSFKSEIDDDAHAVVADPETIQQILSNLFDNAIRYVPVGGTVTFRSVRSENGILTTVADNGSGIAAEHLPRIFERFYRVDPSRSRDEGGTGLGLAIVKHVVEAQGGKVWAESVLREGTSIHCWFPAL